MKVSELNQKKGQKEVKTLVKHQDTEAASKRITYTSKNIKITRLFDGTYKIEIFGKVYNDIFGEPVYFQTLSKAKEAAGILLGAEYDKREAEIKDTATLRKSFEEAVTAANRVLEARRHLNTAFDEVREALSQCQLAFTQDEIDGLNLALRLIKTPNLRSRSEEPYRELFRSIKSLSFEGDLPDTFEHLFKTYSEDHEPLKLGNIEDLLGELKKAAFVAEEE